jgi:type II secretory pathway pseudopilin PulG
MPANAPTPVAPPAFTLVELLLVIGIVGALLAIVLPALAPSREAARTVVCASQLKQMIAAFKMYTNDHNMIPISGPEGPVEPLELPDKIWLDPTERDPAFMPLGSAYFYEPWILVPPNSNPRRGPDLARSKLQTLENSWISPIIFIDFRKRHGWSKDWSVLIKQGVNFNGDLVRSKYGER